MEKSTQIAEMRLLNAMYLDSEFHIRENILEDHLVSPPAKTLFSVLSSLIDDNVPLSRNSIFERWSKIDINASIAMIESIIDINSEPLQVATDIKEDLQFSKQKVLALENLNDAIALLSNTTVTLTEKQKKEAKEKIMRAYETLNPTDEEHKAQNLEEVMDDYMVEFDKRKNGKQYIFGDVNLDNLVTNGPAPGGGGIIYASTGMAKTSYIVHLANQFINTNVPTIFFELEMSKVSCFDRLLSRRLGIPFRTIVNPTPYEHLEIKQAILKERENLNKNVNFRFSDNPSNSIEDIRMEIKKFQKEIGQDYCIVLIDLLSMVKDFCQVEKGFVLAGQIEMAINKMNALAKELNFHYIGTVQANRTAEADKILTVEDIPKMKPSRSAIKNSSAFLERSRYCLSLFRPKYYADIYLKDDEEAELMEDVLTVSLMKQNDGGLNSFELLFNPNTFSFASIES